jgi:hypothetical protein
VRNANDCEIIKYGPILKEKLNISECGKTGLQDMQKIDFLPKDIAMKDVKRLFGFFTPAKYDFAIWRKLSTAAQFLETISLLSLISSLQSAIASNNCRTKSLRTSSTTALTLQGTTSHSVYPIPPKSKLRLPYCREHTGEELEYFCDICTVLRNNILIIFNLIFAICNCL